MSREVTNGIYKDHNHKTTIITTVVKTLGQRPGEDHDRVSGQPRAGPAVAVGEPRRGAGDVTGSSAAPR